MRELKKSTSVVKLSETHDARIEFSTWGSSMQHHDIPDTHGNAIKITGYIRQWKIQTIEKYGSQSQVNIIFWGNVSFKELKCDRRQEIHGYFKGSDNSIVRQLDSPTVI